ncbi:ATP-binding protein [Candidatus Palauibacter sp.]|uniref:ATP-binding protein n=1 Tax=Candidatus Palauibacter sp. TaxID=3101350 RepID=UPI003B01DDDB
MFIERPIPARRIREEFSAHPCVALTGPRQCGKSTLARRIAADDPASSYFDLEAGVDRRRLATPEQTLGPLEGLVVIDEIQRLPSLFETIRVLVDRPANNARFLLLGSASPRLVRGVSESLAGRVGLVDLGGFHLGEVDAGEWRTLWTRGGFPRSYLAADDRRSLLWRQSFIGTFLERDIPQLGITIPAERLRRFWSMIAHYHGQTWNGAEFARALGTSEATARRYLDILTGAFMVRALPPWFENLKKRQVKAPKVYVRDTGLLHELLGLSGERELAGHHKVGASFEGFAVEQLLAGLDTRDAYFWATHGGAELDLLVFGGGKRYGFECKFADAPGTTRSMRVALEDLGLSHLWIVYPGEEAYPLDDRISVLPISQVGALAATLSR